MLIVDAQVHAWQRGEATGHHRKSPITTEVLIAEMDAAGVDRGLLVPPLWDPTGNAYSLKAAQEYPDRFAVMGLLQAGSRPPGECRDLFAGWQKLPGMHGVRFLFNSTERLKLLREGVFDWVWPMAEEQGVAVALLIPNALAIAADIAMRHPGLRIIVDHLGVPRGASGARAFAHLPELLALARFPNLAVKAVGVGDYALDGYPFASLDGPLQRVFDAFGPERMIWGSDLSRLRHPYRQCVTHFSEETRWLSEADRALVMGLNLCRIIGWDTASTAWRRTERTEDLQSVNDRR